MIVVKNLSKITDQTNKSYKSNKGQELETSVRNSNDFYVRLSKAFITKKPTPIHIVTVKNSIITKAYFEEDSTLDFYGIYKGKYIEFDCKSTDSKTSFPLKNLAEHQYFQLKLIDELDGLAFLIIEFSYYSEYYILLYKQLELFKNTSKSKSIKIDYFRKNCVKIKEGFKPRLYYLEALDEALKNLQ